MPAWDALGHEGHGMGYSLRQAAEVCGKGRSTIHRALQSGKLSGTKNDNGEWSIDGSELARAFPWDSHEHVKRDELGHSPSTDQTSEILQMKISMLEQQLEREQETVTDLRKRLDRAEERMVLLTGPQNNVEKNRSLLGWLLNR